jgi:hypothetical protein
MFLEFIVYVVLKSCDKLALCIFETSIGEDEFDWAVGLRLGEKDHIGQFRKERFDCTGSKEQICTKLSEYDFTSCI